MPQEIILNIYKQIGNLYKYKEKRSISGAFLYALKGWKYENKKRNIRKRMCGNSAEYNAVPQHKKGADYKAAPEYKPRGVWKNNISFAE